MALIDDIIQITITRQTATAKVASFNGILMAAEFLIADITPAFSERVRKYTSLSEIATAGFPTSGPIYLAAQALFSQNPNVGEIYVGRKLTGGDGSETWAEALTAMLEDSNKWYGFSVGTKVLIDLEAAADWSEANKKLFLVSDDDANIISGTGDIAEYAETNNLDRTAIMYHPDADESASDPYAAVAWMGKLFTYDPGSVNWAHKTLNAVPSYALTSAERTTVEGKNCNFYEEVAGVDVTLWGTVGSGEYIDIIRGIDWLEARIQERVFNVLINNDKVPFTDQGIQAVVSELRAALQEGVDNNLIAPPDVDGNPGYTVTYPRASEVSTTDKANRLLPDIEFAATLAGAINKVEIQGVVSL